MIKSVIYRPAAAYELREAYGWYEDRESGLGSEFLRCIDARMELIRRFPEIFPIAHKTVRQAVVRRFPHSIFYIRRGSSIIVLSVFHSSRDPIIWK